MALKIVRNDITKMNTEAVVNTANKDVCVGAGCDYAIYSAAGFHELLKYRKEHIGCASFGDAFITPGFNLQAKYIIHVVSPVYEDGNSGETEKLRECYKNALKIAVDNNIKSISFPLISTGSFGYPKEEGIRIAVDEINAALLKNDLDIFLVIFDEKSLKVSERINDNLNNYISDNYVKAKLEEEYVGVAFSASLAPSMSMSNSRDFKKKTEKGRRGLLSFGKERAKCLAPKGEVGDFGSAEDTDDYGAFLEEHEGKLEERIKHMSDTFSEYLLFLIKNKNMENSDVYKRAIVDRKIFSKIKGLI